MPFEIVRNDITNMTVDAIVNTANPRPVIGLGTDSMIHEKAGPKLLIERQKIGTIDVGNAAIGLGTSYGIALSVMEGNGFSWKRIGKALSRAVALMTYVVMVILSLLHIRLPQPMLDFADIVGSANTFVAMLMIGVGFRLNANKQQLGRLLKLLALRYGIGALLAIGFWNLPFDLLTRQTLVILALSPIITAAPAFTGELKGDVGLSSAFNSICIVVSLVIYVALLSFMV